MPSEPVARRGLEVLGAPYELTYRLREGSVEGSGGCARLALEGLVLVGDTPLPVGCALSMTVALPGAEGEPFVASGRVERSAEGRQAGEWTSWVAFQRLAAPQHRRLYDFIAARLARGEGLRLGSEGAVASRYVLVVDDDAVTRRVIGMKLRKVPEVSVLLASSGAEALRLAEERLIDVVILDTHLPDIDELELLGELRERSPRLAPILVTHHPGGRGALEARLTEACDFLTKPFDDLGELRRVTLRNLELARLRRERDALVSEVLLCRDARGLALGDERAEK